MATLVTRRNLLWLAPLAVLALAGCQQMAAESTMAADGSGTRTLTLTLDEGSDESAARAALPALAAGDWERSITVKNEDGREKKLPTLRRTTRVRGLADWAATSGDVRVQAAPGSDIRLDNHVSVEKGADTWTYRETFAWTGAYEALIGCVASCFRDDMAAAHPQLTAAQLAELRGLAAGVCTMGARAQAKADGSFELDEELAATTLAELAGTVLDRAGVRAEQAAVRTIAATAIHAEDGRLKAFIARELPGFDFADDTSLDLRVVMPGRVVATNGTLGDDGVVTWSFSLVDPLVGPRECWVRAQR